MTISVRVTIKPSRLLLYLLCLMVVLANIGWYLFLLNIGLPSISFVIAVAGFAIVCVLSLIVARSRSRVSDLNVLKSGDIFLQIAGQIDSAKLVKLHRSSVIWQYVMALCFVSDDGKIHRILILPDSVSLTAFHRLRVALLWILMHHDKATARNANGAGNF
ncbi:protein YgfX [Undibacterium rivi]|nr:protein YgfX [Undibacterium rivi]